MSEASVLGVVVEFTADADVDIVMTPSRPSKAECLMIGWEFYDAAVPEQDAMLEEFGGVLVRRSLKVFGNYANRTGQREVAEYVALLRAEITLAPTTTDEAAS